MIHFVMLALFLALLWPLQQMLVYAQQIGALNTLANIPGVVARLNSDEFRVLRARTRRLHWQIIGGVIPLIVTSMAATIAVWLVLITGTPISDIELGALAVALSGVLVYLWSAARPEWLTAFRMILMRTYNRVQIDSIQQRLLEIADIVELCGQPKTSEDVAHLQALVMEAEYLASVASSLQQALGE